MESNRDEAERCIGIALAAVKANQPERARRFLEKAQRLYPSPRVRGERRRARGGARGGGGVPGRAVRPARCHRSSGGPRLRAVGRRAGRAGEASPSWEGAAGLGTGGRPAAFLMRVRHVRVGKRGCEGTGLTGGRKITRSTLERRRWPPVREAYAAGSAETACSLSRASSGPGGGRPNCPIPPRERRASLEAFRCYREILAWVLRKGAPPEGGGHCTELLLEFKEQLDDALRCSV